MNTNPIINREVREALPHYHSTLSREAEDNLIRRAMAILEARGRNESEALTSPEATAAYLSMRLEGLAFEVFGVVFLDNRHRVIEIKEVFRGTIDGSSVHPREVVAEAIHYNAAAVVFYHNHPSGIADPSGADHRITQRLKEALWLLEIRVLDHFVIGSGGVAYSFAEHGVL